VGSRQSKRLAKRSQVSRLRWLRRHSLAHRLAVHHKVARLVVGPTDVSETQKVEGLRLSFSTLLASLSGKPPELNQRPG
jgi:hypothetical protein